MSMKRYAAFLRGVSPMNAKMPDLVRSFEAAGFSDVKTLLSSGNVVFSARARKERGLEVAAEVAMQETLGRTFMTFVRPIDELREMLQADPYRLFRLPAGSKRVVTFLHQAPPKALTLPPALEDARILCVVGRVAYCVYVPGPKGPVFMNVIEKTFGKEVTTRTWQTVERTAK